MKFAQFDFIKQQSNLVHILLLDDIFDKLDQDRVTQTIQLFDNESLGQIFISDTQNRFLIPKNRFLVPKNKVLLPEDRFLVSKKIDFLHQN